MAYYSEKGSVHHIYETCHLGNNIEKENRKNGTGGKPLCEECEKIKAEKLKEKKKK
ncbi:MAG: hypothetical protein WCQ76_04945 [Fusobacterium sp.]